MLLFLVVFDAYVSNRIKIRYIEIEGVRVLQKDEVYGVLQKLKGKWIFVLYFDSLERKLTGRFGFKRVKIVPVWPAGVVVRVVEPSIMFILVNRGHKWLAMDGFVVYPYRKGVCKKGVVLVKVDYPMKLFIGKRIRDLFLRKVGDYLKVMKKESFNIVKVELVSAFKVIFYTRRGFRFVCRGDGKELWKFRYLNKVFAREKKKDFSVVDMRFGNSVVLR